MLLTIAQAAFAKASDPVGAGQAAILSAITALRTGDLEVASAGGWAALEEGYGGLRQALDTPSLPETSELRARSRAEGAAPLAGMAVAPDWEDWLARWLLCLVVRDTPKGQKLPAATEEWLRARYGEQLPAEMDLTRFSWTYEQEQGKNTQETGAGDSDSVIWIIFAAGAAIVILLVLGILVGGYFLVDLGIRKLVAPGGLGIGWTILIEAGFLVMLFLALWSIPKVRDRYRSLLAGQTLISLSISAPSRRPGRRLDLGSQRQARFLLRHRKRRLRAWPQFSYQAPTEEEATGTTPGIGPYLEARKSVPTSIVQALDGLQNRLGWRTLLSRFGCGHGACRVLLGGGSYSCAL